MGKSWVIQILIILAFSSCNICNETAKEPIGGYPAAPNRSPVSDWTFLLYYNADNNLEKWMMKDMEEINASLEPGLSIKVIVMIDRIEGFSDSENVFGENFTDTRLYEFSGDTLHRLGGGEFLPQISKESTSELNMGDIQNLRDYIRWAKYYFEARQYALIIGNHGTGIGDFDVYGARGVSYDDTNTGFISIRDFSTGLSAEESVDLLVFDACNMNYAEIAYEIAPIQENRTNPGFSAKWMVSSPQVVVAEGFAYDRFFDYFIQEYHSVEGNRISSEKVGQLFLNAQAAYLDKRMEDLGMDALYDYEQTMTYSLLDLSKLDVFKTRIDELSSLISAAKTPFLEQIYGNIPYSKITNDQLIYYFNSDLISDWVYYPGVDAYSMLQQLQLGTHENSAIDIKITQCLNALDEVVYSSFGTTFLPGFTAGKHGLAIFLPKGYLLRYQQPIWRSQTWYNQEYLQWSDIGTIKDNGVVDTYYELVESLVTAPY